MARELSFLLSDAGYAASAASLARAVRAEDAAGTACDALLARFNHTG